MDRTRTLAILWQLMRSYMTKVLSTMNGELGDKGANETKDNAKKRAATGDQNELEYGAANVYAFFQARKLTVCQTQCSNYCEPFPVTASSP